MEHTGFHDKKHFSPDCYECRASLTPEWIREYEEEQNDKLEILRKEIDIKRENAFSVSLFGDREHQVKMDAMVNAYDVVKNLIKEMTNGRGTKSKIQG